MKNLISYIISLFFLTQIIAQESDLIIKNQQNWSLRFNIDNNYNYRYAKNPISYYFGNPPNYDYEQAAIDYLDSNNIACTMKSISIKLERKLWKFIGFQSGFIIGHKGYIGCRNIVIDGIGIPRLYYTNMPLHTFTLPIGISLNKSILNKRINISANVGTEVNFIIKNYDNYQNNQNLPTEKKGFFGFKSSKDIDNSIPYEPHEQGIIGFPQYFVGINLKFMIFKNSFLNIEYNYVSDFKFYTIREDFFPRTYEYERKSYINRYGGGIGFMF
jgi:hypothetical protein